MTDTPNPGETATEDVRRLVRQIHAAPRQFVLALNGGSQAIADLLVEPGGSQTVLEAIVPYSTAALKQWLGSTPEHFCSARTARAMAMAAYLRAQRLAATDSDPASAPAAPQLAGIACSASLASDRPKRGAHRIHLAAQTAHSTSSCSLELIKGRRTRAGEEDIAARLTLNLIAEVAGIADRLPLDLDIAEQVVREQIVAPQAWRDLLAGTIAAAKASTNSELPRASTDPPAISRAIFPGAFNPLHDGHRQMAQVAAKLLGRPVEFEISIENVDKPPLDFLEMTDRARQFDDREALWFTRAATFIEKASLFPQATFAVGADTLVRIADPRYYGGDPAAALRALTAIEQAGGRFLVFGRLVDGKFLSLAELELPAELLRLCQDVPPEQFRADVSSTELRRSNSAERSSTD